MARKPRYLTKSRFKLALECPTKLFYTGKKDIYPDRKLDDSFLLALADGGYQVGELAKHHFPGGYDITTLDYDEALQQTQKLLSHKKSVAYEAAIRHENLFVRIDVLVKDGKQLDLIEVKAKSFDRTADEPFVTRKGTINSIWKGYLYDIAFQKHVLKNAFPNYKVNAYLMLTDKNAICTVDGLNQKFRIMKGKDGRKTVRVSDELSDFDLAEQMLCKVNVDRYCDLIYQEEIGDFSGFVSHLSDNYARDQRLDTPISPTCAQCEFKATPEEEAQGKKSGFKECWKAQLGWRDADFREATVLDIWNYRGKGRLIEAGRLKLRDVEEADIHPRPDGKPGISASERQWLQIQKEVAQDESIWIDRDSLAAEMKSWRYPLHFIDFETAMVALPFNKGRHPYEGIAFQFSHHVVYEDERVEHRGEYLNTQPGVFPNYEFLRALKSALEGDEGSIFRYSNHENSFLNIIYQQLKNDSEDIHDRDELCEFIRSITHSSRSCPEAWVGERDMIDLWALGKRYYYDPFTKGSNSIKSVLPAILNSSTYLKDKYSKPVYGAEGGIRSRNFKDWIWVELEDDVVIDPYKKLPKMFADVNDHDLKLLSNEDELNNGGLAMTAYGRMQFEEMSDYERNEICMALLKYCELDTLAMVMIYEGWRELVQQDVT